MNVTVSRAPLYLNVNNECWYVGLWKWRTDLSAASATSIVHSHP